MRVKLIFSYDGSKFNGFQRQNNQKSIQKTIEDALTKLLNKKIEIKGAGRTDTGVHAYGQVAHVDILKNEYKYLKYNLNKILNPDIRINKIVKVDDDFHARLSVKKKKYIYKINLGVHKTEYENYYYQPYFKLNIAQMQKASKYLIGTHDFHNFVSGLRENYVSTIYNIKFKQKKDILEISFIGTAFYRYMIRNIMGALIEIGKCKENPSIIKNMLDNPNEDIKMPTAPAMGLYLYKIWY